MISFWNLRSTSHCSLLVLLQLFWYLLHYVVWRFGLDFLQCWLFLERIPLLEVYPSRDHHPHFALLTCLALQITLHPLQYLVAGPDWFVEIDKGRRSFRFIGTYKLEKAFFVFDRFFDTCEVFLVLKIVFLHIVESLLFWVEGIECLGSKKVSECFVLFEDF